MTPRPLLDTSCLVCGFEHSFNGHICTRCYLARYGHIRPQWFDETYAQEMRCLVAADDRARTVAARQEGKAA